MEDQRTFKTPLKTLARLQVVHFGKILFNMQFIAVAIMIASIVSFLIPVVFYIVLVAVLLLSLFTLLTNPTFKSFFQGGATLTNIAEVMSRSWKYTIPIVAALSIASIVCLCFDKNKKQIARIVISSITCTFSLVLLFFKLANSGVFQ